MTFILSLLVLAQIWFPASIHWQRFDKDGTRYAVLSGSRDQPGQPFVYAFWMPGGVWVKPHIHSQQAHVAVLQGSLKLDFGSRFDKSATTTIPAGSFFVVKANEPHFEGSDGECLIIGTALGNWSTTEIP